MECQSQSEHLYHTLLYEVTVVVTVRARPVQDQARQKSQHNGGSQDVPHIAIGN